MRKLAVLVGSLRKDSLNKQLAKSLAGIGKDLFEFNFPELGDLPLLNQDLETNLPPAVVRFKEEIKAADGALFVTPEYNRSLPSVLKNALDWASRPMGQNVWIGKPVAICGGSPGALGAGVAQTHLRGLVGPLGMSLMGAPEMYIKFTPDFFNAQGGVASESTEKFLRSFLTRFADWVERQLKK